MTKRRLSNFLVPLILFGFLIFIGILSDGCYECKDAQCSNVPNVEPIPPDWPAASGNIEVYSDGSEAAATSPCGMSCKNFQKLGCPEGQAVDAGSYSASCYKQCLKKASLTRIPSKCWSEAPDVPTLRKCGGIRCVP